MDLKQLKIASKLLEKLEVIDKEIIEIDKIALSILNNETKINFDLKVENLSKNKDSEETKDSSNPLKELEKRMIMAIQIPTWALSQPETLKNQNTLSISNKIDDKLALQILGVILCEKNKERDVLIEKINSSLIDKQ
ncbi:MULTISPECIES: hypothetical protein [Flavobacterium]|uniref:Uncharacterized protein n=1 Tax=Flavobacterium keumense TaxID=1306518 RepID=A0ABY8N273_9FLAO|nr:MULTISPECIES: hypothetical protein [Flavobacterium]WGK93750.1 hypothetical protein MG292_06515 [Flavobacterium keumense]